jgi:hypothetical protein
VTVALPVLSVDDHSDEGITPVHVKEIVLDDNAVPPLEVSVSVAVKDVGPLQGTLEEAAAEVRDTVCLIVL